MNLPQQPYQWTGTAHFGPSLTNSFDKQQQFDRGVTNPEGKSRLRSPIPADPGYGDNVRGSSAPCGTGRVLRLNGSDAKQIYKRATGSEGAPYLHDVRCSILSRPHSKTGVPPKNYLNENAKRIQRIMRKSKQRQATKAQSQPKPVKALWHSKQYDNVQSKVKQKLEEDNQRSSSRPQSVQGNFLRAHANTGPEILRSQSVSDSRRDSVASSVNLPTTTTTTQVDDKTKPDYVKINSKYVKNIPKVRKTISTEAVEQAREKQENKLKTYHEKQKGRVPDYIEKIKEKRDQDIHEASINAPDPECPLGHIKVDNNQRVSTLQQLQFNRTELQKKLSQLPVRNDTVTLRRTKEDIEKKLVELDEAILIFSKPKVFIKMDE